ncbi:hypothetical protein AS132_17550 [Photobacterium sanguinicancri]|nr:hypothetical protein AS132_17550 [Photobacterium sanguinicancri]
MAGFILVLKLFSSVKLVFQANFRAGKSHFLFLAVMGVFRDARGFRMTYRGYIFVLLVCSGCFYSRRDRQLMIKAVEWVDKD